MAFAKLELDRIFGRKRQDTGLDLFTRLENIAAMEHVDLARSCGCDKQAVRYGDHVLGLQFHLELAPDNARALCRECADELRDGGPWVQSEAEMLADPALFHAARQRLHRLLEVFLPDRG